MGGVGRCCVEMRHTGASVWVPGVLKQEKAAGPCVSAAGSHRSAKPSGRAVFGAFSARCGSLCGVVPRCRKWRFYGVGMMSERRENESGKRQSPVRLMAETGDNGKSTGCSAQDDCGSLSEFIEKAVLAYLGYLSAGENTAFLPGAFLSTMRGIVAESDHRHASMLFKLSVEMAMLMNIVAATQEIDKLTLERLRGECGKEVKRLNGTFSMEDAVNWQSS